LIYNGSNSVAETFSAEGRSILMILSNFLSKMRIHSYFGRILIFAFLSFFCDQTGRLRQPAAGLTPKYFW